MNEFPVWETVQSSTFEVVALRREDHTRREWWGILLRSRANGLLGRTRWILFDDWKIRRR